MALNNLRSSCQKSLRENRYEGRMKNNENPFSRRPRNETMEITNNEVGRRKNGREKSRWCGATCPTGSLRAPRRQPRSSFSLLCTVATRCASLRAPPPPPPPSSRATRTWLIFTASCVPRPKKNEVFPVYDLINIETRGQWGRSRRENCCFNVSSSLNKTAN